MQLHGKRRLMLCARYARKNWWVHIMHAEYLFALAYVILFIATLVSLDKLDKRN